MDCGWQNSNIDKGDMEIAQWIGEVATGDEDADKADKAYWSSDCY